MIGFERIDGPFQIPVWYQHLPLKTVSLLWVVFTGSADDEAGGGHGVFHWFEHMPSRGTRKYPHGYRDTESRLVRHGGAAGAESGYTHTAFHAEIPRRAWPETLDILTDMIACPLLRDEDVAAERQVIELEIDEWHSDPYSASVCELPAVLWPAHPLGHDQLGTRESLAAISRDGLRYAHETGYARSRCVLFVAGDVDRQQLLDEVASGMESMSSAAVSERRRPATYGPLPRWRGGEQTVIETDHEDSVAYLLFPVPPLAESPYQFVEWELVEELLTAGGLGSPLNRFIRERAGLAYSPDFTGSLQPDGGYIGLVSQTRSENPDVVIDEMRSLLASDELRSQAWHDYVRDTIRGEIDLHDPDAGGFTDAAAESLMTYGSVWSDPEYLRHIEAVSRDVLNSILDSLTPDQSRSVVFRGK